MPYSIHSRDYLARAKARLGEDTIEGMFYAAYELRCGIEARLQEYLEVQQENTARIKQGWQIAKLNAHLKKHFNSGDKVIRIKNTDRRSNEVWVWLYTPVTAKLRKMDEKLGNYLHATVTYRRPEDAWWSVTRRFIEAVAEELTNATSGNLLGAPLLNPATREIRANVEARPGEDVNRYVAMFGPGREITAKVEYFDRIPE